MRIDIVRFRKESGESKEELTYFLSSLKETRHTKMLLEQTDKKVWEDIHCLDCANCCKTMTPVYNNEDIKRISAHLKMPQDEYRRKYLLQDQEGEWTNLSIPCHFLGRENKCTIYEIRPASCRGYPHHDLPFTTVKKKMAKNLTHCPATFELVKRMKNEK
jgi:Fe-S-cluster containining protein